MKTSSVLGILSGVSSIILWVVLIYFNPYSSTSNETDVITRTFIMLFLPACLAILASLTSKKALMLTAFFWSLPISLYLVGTPGIFALFGVTSISYLISFIFMRAEKKRAFDQ